MDDKRLIDILKNRRGKDNFSVFPTDSLPFINQVVEGLSPLTEARDKSRMMTELDTPGSISNKDETFRSYEELMRTTQPGAWHGSDPFIKSGPESPVGPKPTFEKMWENPQNLDIYYLEGEERDNLIGLSKSLKDVDESSKSLRDKVKETKTKEDDELLEKFEKTLRASFTIYAQEEDKSGEEGAEVGGGKGLDLGLGGKGLDLGLGGDEGGGFDLGLGGELGLPKEKEEGKEEGDLFVDVDLDLLENLDEVTKEKLLKSLLDLKKALSKRPEEISVSQLKTIFNEIVSCIKRAKTEISKKKLTEKEKSPMESTNIENINKYYGAYIPRRVHPDTYYLMNAYNSILRLGARVHNIYVMERNFREGQIKIAVTIEYYNPLPMASDEYKTKKIPLIMIYDVYNEKPTKLLTVAGREVDFSVEGIRNLVEYHKKPVDFFIGYYNTKFMKKKRKGS